jgi:predicted nucleotidyltransferase
MIGLLESKREAIAEGCARHGVVRLEVFGSGLRDDFKSDESDLDLWIESRPWSRTRESMLISAYSMNSGPCWIGTSTW